ncbi:MAG: tRNA (N6-threonylcarbamoyladenosine(37)-N6)-methyltransferase TrmO [Syntrophomonadaceae bacterium]|nr:tRNA (N6-threonylcarbamoyladenosine(37)-N6)-methyltransferase TrmO [Syntrophomonadaceae bacterium]
MIDDLGILLRPIGVVRSASQDPDDMPLPGQPGRIEIFPEYAGALLRIEVNSHLWLLTWFHKSDRRCLRAVPRRFNSDLPEYGVFGLRSPNRPNPIALTLVRLDSVEDNILYVHGLDAIDGTPVLDIKSYYENDIVFSPTTPYIRMSDPEWRRNIFLKQALNHHREECCDYFMAVRMALVADEYMGHLNRPDLHLTVKGSACLADTLQGLSRARLANPCRFAFSESAALPASIWTDRQHSLKLKARTTLDKSTFIQVADQELFDIEFI